MKIHFVAAAAIIAVLASPAFAVIGGAALVAAHNAGQSRELDAFVKAAKASAVRSLRDPESARFDSLYVAEREAPGRNGEPVRFKVLCGTVNARNGMGGYAGAVRFYATVNTATIESPERTLFSEQQQQWCGHKIVDVK